MESVDTVARLEGVMQADLAWRRKELSSIYLDAISSSGDARFRSFRSGIVFCYAHYEGFTRAAARQYLQHVKQQGLSYGQLAPCFVSLKISKMINQGTTKASYYSSAVDLLTKRMGDIAQLPDVEVISAHSNLTFARLKEILYCVNVDVGPFQLKEIFIDEVLLERRNAIAHGEFRRPDLDDYVGVHREVLDIIDMVNDRLVECANTQRYRA